MYLSMFLMGAAALTILTKAIVVPVYRKIRKHYPVFGPKVNPQYFQNISLMEKRLDNVVKYDKQEITEKTKPCDVRQYHDYLVDRVTVYDMCKLLGLGIIRTWGNRVDPQRMHALLAKRSSDISKLYQSINKTGRVGWLDIFTQTMEYISVKDYEAAIKPVEKKTRKRRRSQRIEIPDMTKDKHPVDEGFDVVKRLIDSIYEEVLV